MVKTVKRSRAATDREVAEARELFSRVHAAAVAARRQQWLHRDTADALDSLIGLTERGLEVLADEDDGTGDFPP